jgi:hypothetical protein
MKKLLTSLTFCAFSFGGLAVAGAGGDDLPEKLVKMVERMASDTDTNKPDCDKIATALHKHADEDAALMKAVKDADAKKTKEQKAAEKKELEAKYGERLKAAMTKMMPLKECKDNAKIKEYRTKVGM